MAPERRNKAGKGNNQSQNLLAKVRDTSEILFRVLKRYYIHLAKNIKMLRKKKNTRNREESLKL